MGGQHSLRKRNPSPTPSAVSSTSSASHHSNNIHNQNNQTTTSSSSSALPAINGEQGNTKKGLNTSGNSLGANTSFPNQTAVLNSLSPSNTPSHQQGSNSTGSPMIARKGQVG